MKTLTERLNFSNQNSSDAIIIKKEHAVNSGAILRVYCADNDIDLIDISDEDFDSAVIVMSDYGLLDKQQDQYFFWIDQK